MGLHRIQLLRWGVIARRHPSAFLLAAQFGSLVANPLIDDGHGGRMVFGSFGVLLVVLTLWVVRRSPMHNWIAWLLAVPALLLSALSALTDAPVLLTLSAMLESMLYFYAAASLMLYMLSDQRVTADELLACGATFTVLAWAFAYAFVVCQAWYPDSFTGALNPGEPRTWIELLFLSFTTLSGVGIGDVLPLSPPARVLVMIEQFAGVGYIATVVSRLIGLTILHHQRA